MYCLTEFKFSKLFMYSVKRYSSHFPCPLQGAEDAHEGGLLRDQTHSWNLDMILLWCLLHLNGEYIWSDEDILSRFIFSCIVSVKCLDLFLRKLVPRPNVENIILLLTEAEVDPANLHQFLRTSKRLLQLLMVMFILYIPHPNIF